jgi:hypothetical protein
VIHLADVAESQLGVFERTGKNDGIPAHRYNRGDEVPWCAAGLLWCNEVSDDPDFTDGSAKLFYRLRSVTNWIEWAKEKLRFHPRGLIVPQRNDVVFFGETDSDVGVKGNHCGVVTSLQDGRIHTVEFNTSNKVARRSYLTGDRTIIGYLR